jgi:hypothetical protein
MEIVAYEKVSGEVGDTANTAMRSTRGSTCFLSNEIMKAMK